MQADDERQVRAVVGRMLRAIDYADVAELDDIWIDDSSMFFPFLNTPLLAVGKPAVLARLTALFAKLAKDGLKPPFVGFSMDDNRINIVGDAALCTFTYAVGQQIARRTMFLVRRDGKWRIQHVHGSNAKSPGV
jgi:uncharacterized protein (TIGR02246 family)